MTKEFVGNLWTESDTTGKIKLGFSKRFIEEKLVECFHVTQADTQMIKTGGPLMVIETNDGLESLKSPLSGTVLYFNTNARNFPDRIKEDDVIMEVLPEGMKLEKTVAPKSGEITINWGQLEELFNTPLSLEQHDTIPRQQEEVRAEINRQAQQLVRNRRG